MGEMRIALAGNPNCGKTTLFNALTGSTQYVGNWPGVTVEKKEGHLKGHKDVVITDLPGIYSLAPYTLEEVVARSYLIKSSPEGILNIVDGTNLERNLYLTTQLLELGLPTVVAINMMDIVEKNGDTIDAERLSEELGCPVIKISALKGAGIADAAEIAIKEIEKRKTHLSKVFSYSETVEKTLSFIGSEVGSIPEKYRRWYEIKIFERDEKVLEELGLTGGDFSEIESRISSVEREMDDDAESIIINDRYNYLGKIIDDIYIKKDKEKQTTSEKIDRIVTNRVLALPIFAGIMFLVYFISITTVGSFFTDWVNDGVFGKGWHLFGIGTSEYREQMDNYAEENIFTQEAKAIVSKAAAEDVAGASNILQAMNDNDYTAFDEAYGYYSASLSESGYSISGIVDTALNSENVPKSENYGIFVPSVPSLIQNGLNAVGCAEWLQNLIINGMIAGIGAVLGFVPQLVVLFLLLSFLEACGYMTRIAFVLDRIFRRFGLSGKSFIPMLIGTGCGVPGIMASRTIENEQDRRMTVMTTTFIPCGAKLPIIALIASVLFHGAWWVAPSAYFIGIAAIVISGVMLKKTKPFMGDVAPFIMELPAYHWPTVGNIARTVWERISSFVRKAGTTILLASIAIWAGSKLGWIDGVFTYSADMALESSVLGVVGNAIKWIFVPLGFGNIKAAIATVMGLIAKEEIVGVFGVLDFGGMTPLAAYAFLAFNLLCAPCFAAIGAIKREMNSAKWTWFAIGYQCGFAYIVSLMIYQFGMAASGQAEPAGFAAAAAAAAFLVYMLVRPKSKTNESHKEKKIAV